MNIKLLAAFLEHMAGRLGHGRLTAAELDGVQAGLDFAVLSLKLGSDGPNFTPEYAGEKLREALAAVARAAKALTPIPEGGAS